MIVCGNYHTVMQNVKNEVYVCGRNEEGQLGLGDYKNRDKFEKVNFDFGKIKNIACRGNYTVIQNEKNEIYVCGNNEFGQLGLGDHEYRNIFEKVNFDFGEIKNIACGSQHIIIQNEKNEVYVCGRNIEGQLGLKDEKDRYNFEKVDYDFGKIKNIACGSQHIIVQNEKNEIYVCGYNESGQLGLGDQKNRMKFEKVEYNLGEIKKTVCGSYYTIIQNEKNEIYVCGRNRSGQLGLGDDDDRHKFEKVECNLGEIKKIASGDYHMVIQNEKNEIYVCGRNWDGQLGLGDNKHRDKFEKVDFKFGKIKNIACGIYHTVVQNEKNEIYVCGRNWNGQLGLGDYMNRGIFEKVDTDDIFEKIHNLELKLNTGEIDL